MPDIVCVADLGVNVSGPVGRSVAVLNGCQGRFVFRVIEGPQLPEPDLAGAYSFRLLDDLLHRERQRLNADYLCGVLDRPIQNNFFSHGRRKMRICSITTCDWEYLSWLPVHSFVAHSIVRNLLGMLIGRAHSHNETRGCIYDFCGNKPDYSLKIRTGDICPDCLNFLHGHLDSPTIEIIVAMLERIRLVAIARGECPEEVVEPSLPEIVDRDYPFPIAYCFRSMQVELSYSRKWLKLLELYEVILKYLAFVLLADSSSDRGNEPRPSAGQLSGLGRPSIGHWHATVFELLNRARGSPTKGFAARAVEALDRRTIREAKAASEQLVARRNETRGHGYTEEEAHYQRRYHDGLPLVQALLRFAAPFAHYRLIKVGEGLQHRRGTWTFSSKILRGSHPLFPVQEHQTSTPVDTDCCLLHDEESGDYLSLYPWLLLDICQECFREMIFLYDKLDGGTVVMREYPTNHMKRRPDLASAVESLIRGGGEEGAG